jgi:hypothetical protein
LGTYGSTGDWVEVELDIELADGHFLGQVCRALAWVPGGTVGLVSVLSHLLGKIAQIPLFFSMGFDGKKADDGRCLDCARKTHVIAPFYGASGRLYGTFGTLP